MYLYPRKRFLFKPFMRMVAGFMSGCLLLTIGLPERSLWAEPIYTELWEKSKMELTRYVDRATRFGDEAAWTDYLNMGIATQRVQWEREALHQLDEQIENIEEADANESQQEADIEAAVAEFSAARNVWESAAENYLLEERGRFRARIAALDVAERDESDYKAMIAAAEAAVVGGTSSLDDWMSEVDVPHRRIVDAFEVELAGELARARTENAALSGVERDAFELELTGLESELRKEFEVRDNFFVLRARNRYVALQRSDSVSARLASEEESAEAIGDAIIEDTVDALAQETGDRLTSALDAVETDLAGTVDLNDIGNNWEAKIEAAIDHGLRKWELAEENLYRKRLEWMADNKRSREETDAVWRANHEKLKAARDEYLADLESQIAEGRAEWQARIAEFDRNRLDAEDELNDYIARERERWDAASSELGSMVAGGGTALLEAQDAYRYYQTLLDNFGDSAGDPGAAELYAFYEQQRDYMGESILRFQTVLGGVEGVLPDTMDSTAGDSGLLTDVRAFAGDLPDAIEALDENDFRAELNAEMNARGEDFVLYRRDLELLADRNALFVERLGNLNVSSEFDYSAAADLDGLAGLIDGLDRKYDEQRRELQVLYDRDRGTMDDAARLTAIKSDIAGWFRDGDDENVRLKRETMRYFQRGAAGFYQTDEESDPYMLTKAEYEWELLRRERNYLARKLHQAEAVKRYADLAFQFEAGLELAAVTAEREQIAKVHADLKEVAFKMLQGDPAVDPLAETNPTMAAAEVDRLLAARGIDLNALFAREAELADEIRQYADIAALDTVDEPRAAALIATVELYLADEVAADAREKHPLGAVREKLIEYRELVRGGAGATEIEDRWAVIKGGADLLARETAANRDAYDFDSMRADRDALRALAARPKLPDLSNEIEIRRATIEANAALLEQAAADLDAARETYRQARTDFEALRSGNAGDIIRQDLLNTSEALTGVLHKMELIEDLPGVDPTRLMDPETALSARYFEELGARESAGTEVDHARDILASLQGLEESKARLAHLDAILAANDLSALGPVDLADLIINARGRLVGEGAADEYLNSHPSMIQSMDMLVAARAEFETRQQELSDALALPETDRIIEEKRMSLSLASEGIRGAVESLILIQRGETEGRRRQVFRQLDQRDGGGELLDDRAGILAARDAQTEDLTGVAFDLSAAAAAAILDFFTSNREKTYAELLTLANAAVAGAATTRGVNESISPYGIGDAVAPGSAERELKKWQMVRQYLVQIRGAVDYANLTPDDYDPREPAARWDALLVKFQTLVDDADYHDEFQNSIPTDAADPAVVGLRTERESLNAGLSTLLAESDAGIRAAYLGLGVDERERINDYLLVSGSAESATAGAELRSLLEEARQSLGIELAGFDANYRTIYLSAEAERHTNRLAELSDEYDQKVATRDGAELERAGLISDRADLVGERDAATDPALIGELQTRIDLIDGRLTEVDDLIARLDVGLTVLETDVRQAGKILKEISAPGSTSELAGLARQSLGVYHQNVAMLDWAVRQIDNPGPAAHDADAAANATPPGEQLKAIIGFYETDARGNIVRDGAGTPVVSREFQDLGITEPAADLLNGGHSGEDLQRWAERLADWMQEHRQDPDVAPEIRGAVELLENRIQDFLSARQLIEYRDLDGAALAARAASNLETARVMQLKLARVAELEGKLQRALEQAAQERRDPVAAALAILNQPAGRNGFYLFKGRDLNGEVDGIVDVAAQQRVDELIRLARRLREDRRTARMGAIIASYAEGKNNYLAFDDPDLPEPGADDLRPAYPELDGSPVIDAVDAIAVDAGFRANLDAYIDGAPASAVLFVDEILNVIAQTEADPTVLKAEILTALNALQSQLDSDLASAVDSVDHAVRRDLDLKTTTSVSDLMTAYGGRASETRSAFGLFVAALDPGTAIDDARGAVTAEVDSRLDGAHLSSIRRELRRIAGAASDTTALKTELENYLAALNDPAPGEITALGEELYRRDIMLARATFAAADAYRPADYPEELRELLLVNGFQKGQARYQEYLDQKNSPLPEVNAAAVLDLTSDPVQIAGYFLASELDAYSAANPAGVFMIAADTDAELARGRTIGEYLAGFQKSVRANLSPALEGTLRERIAHREYLRIVADGAGDPAMLDERAYFAGFRDFLLLSKLDDYVLNNGVVLAGADDAARRENFRADFAALLDDPAYAIGGKTLGERMPGTAGRDAFFAMSFAHLLHGDSREDYLPFELEERVTNATLNDPVPGLQELLPAELPGITDYATRDIASMAGAVSETTLATLAREDVLELAAGNADYAGGLEFSDAEFGALVDAAGYAGVSGAVRAQLVEQLKAHHGARTVAGAGSGEAAVGLLRQDRALRSFFADESSRHELELLLAAHADHVITIEEKFAAALDAAHSELQKTAGFEPGRALLSARERAAGRTDAYYDALPAVLQSELDALATDLFGGGGRLSAAEKSALDENPNAFARFFDLRGARAELASGFFESLETAALQVFYRAAGTADLDYVRANRNLAARAFAESVYVAEGRLGSPGAESSAFLAARPDLNAMLERGVADMDPALRAALLDRQPAVDRFFALYQESQQERREIEALFDDPGTLAPAMQLSAGYESAKQAAIQQRQSAELAGALMDGIRAHGDYFARRQQANEREFALAKELQDFANLRGNGADHKNNRFGNYRSFVGMEAPYNQADYDDYLAGTTDTPPLSLDQFHEARLLKGEALPGLGGDTPEQLLDRADWAGLLVSDSTFAPETVALGTSTADTSDDRTVAYRTVYTVSSAAARRAAGLSPDDMLRYVHYENLANNYLEATTDLNRALSAVFTAGDIATERLNRSSGTQLAARIRAEYDATVQTAVDLSDVVDLRQQAEARLATHSGDTLNEARGKVQAVRNQTRENGARFAEAGRRGLMMTMQLVDYLQSVFYDARDEMEVRERDYQTLSARTDANRQAHADANRDYIDTMNLMADWMRRFQAANDEYELRRGVKEYAETPYLFARANDSGGGAPTDGLDEFRGDALEEYELALAALGAVETRLQEAGYAVQTQDRLEDFGALLTALEDPLLRAAIVAPLTATDAVRLLELRDAKFNEFRVLSAAEEDELAALERRDLYARNQGLIDRRADYITHSMRMVRMHKASEIINAEIERRKMVADMKKQKFDSLLARTFNGGGDFNEATAQDNREARNAVYLRMVGLIENGGSIYNEYRAWFAASDGWSRPHYLLSNKVGTVLLNTPGASDLAAEWIPNPAPFGPDIPGPNLEWADILDIVSRRARGETAPRYDALLPAYQATLNLIQDGLYGGGSALTTDEQTRLRSPGFDYNYMLTAGAPDRMPSMPYETGGQEAQRREAYGAAGAIALADQAAIGTWMNAGGVLAEFSGFQHTYNALLHQIGDRDKKAQTRDIVNSVMTPTFWVGYGLVATAGFWSLWQIPIGIGMMIGARFAIDQAEAYYRDAEMRRAALQNNAYGQSTGNAVREVQAAQYEYEDALAALNYFTRVPDMRQLKERMTEWGAQHNDTLEGSTEDLYDLTDEDLKYLFDTEGGDPYIRSDGSTQTLTTQEENDAIDVTANKNDTEFGDIFGRRYDPYSLRSDQPGPLEGGVYRGADGDYIRLKQTAHDGTAGWVYAKLRDNPDTLPPDKAYDMGGIFDLLTDHGQRLRDDRRDAYLTAGNAHDDAGFVLRERDDTMEDLFVGATARADGGREFSGYRVNFEDYRNNASQIQNQELDQRAGLQRHDWELRSVALRDSYEAWEKKIATILQRARGEWNGAEDRFLQEWRNYERDADRVEAEGERAWDEKVSEHFAKKAKWERDVREQAAEKTIENVIGDAVDSLNAQIQLAEKNLGAGFERINKLAAINTAVAEMRDSLPSKAELKKTITGNIKNFNANLTLGVALGRDLTKGLAPVVSDFQREMEAHRQQMNILAKVKVYEQYRRMVDDFKRSIEVQNQQVDDQTSGAALASGFQRNGSIFTRSSGLSRHSVTVNAYQWFDVDVALDSELAKAGFSDKSGSDLTNFLTNASHVEVESYFYVQKLAMQTAFSAIMGQGNAAARKNSRDPGVIGLFSAWVGTGYGETRSAAKELEERISRQQFEQESSQMDLLMRFTLTMNRLSNENLSENQRIALEAMLETMQNQSRQNDGKLKGDWVGAIFDTQFQSAGFGELGSRGARPGGAPLGFYPQLKAAENELQNKDEEWAEDQSLDPFSGLLASMSPGMMVANMVKDYRVAVEVHKRDPGEMLWAQIASGLKKAASAVGAALISVGTLGWGTAAGAALVLAANSWQVNTQTGHVGFEITGESVGMSVVDAMTSFVGGVKGTGSSAGFGAFKNAFKLTGNIIKGGIRGQSFGESLMDAGIGYIGQGLGKYGGDIGKRISEFDTQATMLGGAGLGPAFGQWYGSQFGQQAATIFGEYAKKKLDMRNNYAGVTTASMETMYGWGAGALGGAVGEWLKPKKTLSDSFKNKFKNLYDKDKQQRGTDVLNAAALNRGRREDEFSGMAETGSDFGLLGDVIGAAGGNWLGEQIASGATTLARALGWESGANWMSGRGYRTDAAISDTIVAHAARSGNRDVAMDLLYAAYQDGAVSAETLDATMRGLEERTMAAFDDDPRLSKSAIRTNSGSSLVKELLKQQGINDYSWQEINQEMWKYNNKNKISVADIARVVERMGGDASLIEGDQVYSFGIKHSRNAYDQAAAERQIARDLAAAEARRHEAQQKAEAMRAAEEIQDRLFWQDPIGHYTGKAWDGVKSAAGMAYDSTKKSITETIDAYRKQSLSRNLKSVAAAGHKLLGNAAFDGAVLAGNLMFPPNMMAYGIGRATGLIPSYYEFSGAKDYFNGGLKGAELERFEKTVAGSGMLIEAFIPAGPVGSAAKGATKAAVIGVTGSLLRRARVAAKQAWKKLNPAKLFSKSNAAAAAAGRATQRQFAENLSRLTLRDKVNLNKVMKASGVDRSLRMRKMETGQFYHSDFSSELTRMSDYHFLEEVWSWTQKDVLDRVKSGNPHSRFLENAARPDPNDSYSKVFGKISGEFWDTVKNQYPDYVQQAFKTDKLEIHHWNFNKEMYSEYLFDTNNLFIASKEFHTLLHKFMSPSTDIPIPRRLSIDLPRPRSHWRRP